MENPKCPYCGGEMLLHEVLGDYFYMCKREVCKSMAPMHSSEQAAYAAAMKRENKYREQVEYDVKAALNTLNDNFHKMPYYIYTMLFDQISAIGYAPTCGADMRKEKDDEP